MRHPLLLLKQNARFWAEPPLGSCHDGQRLAHLRLLGCVVAPAQAVCWTVLKRLGTWEPLKGLGKSMNDLMILPSCKMCNCCEAPGWDFASLRRRNRMRHVLKHDAALKQWFPWFLYNLGRVRRRSSLPVSLFNIVWLVQVLVQVPGLVRRRSWSGGSRSSGVRILVRAGFPWEYGYLN